MRESYSSKVKGSFRTLENISLLLELLWSLRKQDPVILSATMATKKEKEGEKYVLVWRNWYAEVVICHRPWSLESKAAAGDGWLNIRRGRRKEAVQWDNWCWAGVLDSHTPFLIGSYFYHIHMYTHPLAFCNCTKFIGTSVKTYLHSSCSYHLLFFLPYNIIHCIPFISHTNVHSGWVCITTISLSLKIVAQ